MELSKTQDGLVHFGTAGMNGLRKRLFYYGRKFFFSDRTFFKLSGVSIHRIILTDLFFLFDSSETTCQILCHYNCQSAIRTLFTEILM